MKATGITRNLSCAYQAIKDLFALAGVAAILGVLFLTFRDSIERAMPAVPVALAEPLATSAEGPTMPVAESPREREQRAVAEYIAKRYRVADDAITGFVATAYRAGADRG
jgi:hypothetical protein